MFHVNVRLMAIVMLILSVTLSGTVALEQPAAEPSSIEGLWFGTWGGGAVGEVVFQPASAEMFIRGNHVEMVGFPVLGKLTGNIRVDARARRMYLTPGSAAGGSPASDLIEYSYELNDDALTLISNEKRAIKLQRYRVADKPFANAKVEFVEASLINQAGDLVITEFIELRAGRAATVYLHPETRSLKTRQSTVLVTQETGARRITIDEARAMVHPGSPVVLAYLHNDEPPPNQPQILWKAMGSPSPESVAVLRTLSRVVRPGTLIFILSARENIPQP
jgi:hypothetical protein